MNRIACSAVVSVLSGVALGAAEVRPAAKAPQVRVMTYNVRYSAGDKKSPDNNWKARRDDFARTVERENPDVVGFQEVLPDQRKWLERRFPDYSFTGEGRNADPHERLAVRVPRVDLVGVEVVRIVRETQVGTVRRAVSVGESVKRVRGDAHEDREVR